MAKRTYILVLDLGTSGVKGVLFDTKLNLIHEKRIPLKLRHPKRDWVEQSPQEILQSSVKALKQATKGIDKKAIKGFAITNQRETTILWDAKTGRPVYPAIVWQDRRTSRYCQDRTPTQHKRVRQKTGLHIDPYFSATKIRWILRHKKTQTDRLLAQSRLRFGTVDTWMLWHLSGQHLTDETNASRTLLYNVLDRSWDTSLLELFDIPSSILPEVKRSADNFGTIRKTIFGASVPILAVCGDQQASMYAAGARRGTTKVTYGTGTFIGQMIGADFVLQRNLFTMLMPSKRKPMFALEGKIQRGGKEVERIMQSQEKLNQFYRKLAKDVDRFVNHLPLQPKRLLVDGGITNDPELLRIQSEVSGVPISRIDIPNGTALGAAMLAKTRL